jgi:hypothetical protein
MKYLRNEEKFNLIIFPEYLMLWTGSLILGEEKKLIRFITKEQFTISLTEKDITDISEDIPVSCNISIGKLFDKMKYSTQIASKYYKKLDSWSKNYQ